MSYAEIDAEITAWADRNGLTLFSEWDGAEARFCYTSSDKGECFQIVIPEPLLDEVTIEAFSIETLNDEEFQQSWIMPVTKIGEGLEDSLSMVDNGNGD